MLTDAKNLMVEHPSQRPLPLHKSTASQAQWLALTAVPNPVTAMWVDWSVGWLVGCLVGWLFEWSGGRVVGWLVDWLGG